MGGFSVTGPVEDASGVGSLKGSALRDAGFETIGDLQSASLADISAVPGIGRALAARIKADVD